jgi:hypothetical protein
MLRQYKTPNWQLSIPDGWTAQRREIVTFFKPDGVGLLTVMTIEGNTTPIPKGEQIVFRGRLPGTMYTSHFHNSHFRAWSLSCRGKRLVFRYSCAQNNAELEKHEVDAIMQSVSECDSD